MKENKIDGITLKECMLAAAATLENNKKQLNDLNVFPVPDGDTGTNMSMTMKSVLKEVLALSEITVPEVANAASRGALKGARGNSGVILSQLLRGLAIPMAGCELVNAETLAAAMRKGVEMAYKAVMKPKEGTILTVARVISEECTVCAKRGGTVYDVIDCAVKTGKVILAKTPDLLPVLKKAGVVDAGGQGLVLIYSAFARVIHGEYVPDQEEAEPETLTVGNPAQWVSPENDLEHISFSYCTEFFVKNMYDFVTEKDILKLRDMLSRIGDSLVVVGDVELVKVHVHTNTPGKALQYAIQLGELDGIKIENMVIQHREIMAKRAAQHKAVGVSAVSSGDGLSTIFRDLGVDDIISGGQTMNPSTEDIVKQIKQVNADAVIVLPNNSNIILAAEQAQNLTEQKVYVVPTKTVPQGIAAMLGFNPEDDAETNYQNMCQTAKNVRTGQVTYAVRNTVVDGRSIEKDDYLGLCENAIASSGKELETVTMQVVAALCEEETDLLTVYYGSEIAEEAAKKLADDIAKAYPDLEVELHYGGQPVYYYIISAE